MLRSPRVRSVRSHFLLLLLGTLLPLVVLAAVTVFYAAWDEFQSTKIGMQNTARALAAAVDREIQASITTLEALATSEVIDRGRPRELHQAVIRLLPTQPGWRTVILHDPDGNTIFHSSFPFGTPRPRVIDPDSFERLVTTLKPTIMDYTQGPVSGPTIGARVPVLRDGKLKYVLTASIDAARLDEILREQGLADSRYAVVYDNTRAQIASSTGVSANRRGDRNGPLIGQVPAEVNTAWVAGPNRAGVESYGAFVRAPLSGFYLAIVVPASEVASTLLNSIWIVSGFSVLAVLMVLLLASVYTRRITGYTQYLVDLAHTIGAGKPVQVGAPKFVKETTLIDNAIAEASALLKTPTQHVVALKQSCRKPAISSIKRILSFRSSQIPWLQPSPDAIGRGFFFGQANSYATGSDDRLTRSLGGQYLKFWARNFTRSSNETSAQC